MRIDWPHHLRHLLQASAFCLAVSGVLYAFNPSQRYAVTIVYSLGIGLSTWALIDFGRYLFPSVAETGWPAGAPALLLPLGGIVGGYLIGTLGADWWFGWSSWDGSAQAHLSRSLLITGLSGVCAIYYFYSRGKSIRLERRMVEARRQATEARLKLLEVQLEPHMLFNTLANLRVLIGTDPARATQMLDHLIAYLRATLSASRSGSHTLREEFERLRDYLEIMAIRMGRRLVFRLDLPEELAGEPVPALLLQPLVENSIRHGLEPRVDGGEVCVRARSETGRLVLEVADTGVGCAPGAALAPAGDGRGFGLAQLRERLSSLYGDRFAIDFETPPTGGTRVTIRFPLQATMP